MVARSVFLAILCCGFVGSEVQAQQVANGAASRTQWIVKSVKVNGAAVALDKKRHKITFTAFAKGRWAMTALHGRRVRAVRGHWTKGPAGNVILSVKTPRGEFPVAKVKHSGAKASTLVWRSPGGVKTSTQPGPAHRASMKFARALGPFARSATTVQLDLLAR